jgi:hypothetical protein
MGICHKYKLIYISIPRTASQSIASILSNTYDSFHEVHEHLTYRELLCLMDETHFYSYHSFTLVRNPYDRFKSIYYEFLKYNTQISFDIFTHQIYNDYFDKKQKTFINNTPIFIKPQSTFCYYNGLLLVDTLLKIESIEKDWDSFVYKYIPELVTQSNDIMLPLTNVSLYKYNSLYQANYTNDLYKIVTEMYESDFDIFHYSKILT